MLRQVLALRPGLAPVCDLPAGAVDAYEIDLEAGHYLYLEVQQQGVDVYIDVVAPGPRPLFRADSPNGAWTPEPVHLVAERAGRYRLEVGVVKEAKKGTQGCYTARIKALRPAEAADRDRASAQQAAWDASQLSADPRRSWEAAAKYERALRLWEQAGDEGPRRPEEQAGDHAAQLPVLHDLEQLYFARGSLREALVLVERGRALAHDLGELHDEAVALFESGRIYDQLGELESARGALEQALGLWPLPDDQQYLASTLSDLGVLHQTRGESWQALGCFRRASELAHDAGDLALEVNARNGIGWIYRSLADWPSAHAEYLETLRLLNRLAGRPHRVPTLTQLGYVELEAGQPETALLYLQRALAEMGKRTPAGNRAAVLNAIGLCFHRQHDYEEARRNYLAAIASYGEQPNAAGAAYALINLGWLEGSLNGLRPALDRFREALRQAEGGRDPAAEALALLGMAVAERNAEQFDSALGHAVEAIRRVELLRAAAARPDLQTSFLARHETWFSVLVEILMAQEAAHRGQGFARQALAYNEQSSARQLLDALETQGAIAQVRGAGGGDERAARWVRLAAEIDELDVKRRRPELPATEQATIERALADHTAQLNDLLASVRPPARAASSGAEGAALLGRDTLLLEYRLAEPHSYLWVLDGGGGLASFELAGRGVLESRVRDIYPCWANDPDTAPAALHRECAGSDGQTAELSRLLLGKLASRLTDQRLAIAGGGALQYLSFAALPDPRGRGGPLARWHEVVAVPSLAVLGKLRARSRGRPPAPLELGVVADPVFGPSDDRLPVTAAWRPRQRPDELPRLAGAKAQADAILALVPGGQARAWRGFDARRELLADGTLGSCRRLHFATHGTHRADRPELSAIVLSLLDARGQPLDGYLRFHDVARHELPAELVVLSACSTALGPEIEGEGMIGLPQAFFTAGARGVVVSLWDVEEDATTRLMTCFYRHLLAERRPPGAALAEAQRDLRREPKWRHPYYWAGFVLQGDWM